MTKGKKSNTRKSTAPLVTTISCNCSKGGCHKNQKSCSCLRKNATCSTGCGCDPSKCMNLRISQKETTKPLNQLHSDQISSETKDSSVPHSNLKHPQDDSGTLLSTLTFNVNGLRNRKSALEKILSSPQSFSLIFLQELGCTNQILNSVMCRRFGYEFIFTKQTGLIYKKPEFRIYNKKLVMVKKEIKILLNYIGIPNQI